MLSRSMSDMWSSYDKRIIKGGEKMPAGDRTGPRGIGPITGRGLGFCAGYPTPGYMNSTPGRGFFGRGRGFGGGRGFGRRLYLDNIYPVYSPIYTAESTYRPNPKDEKKYLEEVVLELEDELKAVKKRLEEVSKIDKKE